MSDHVIDFLPFRPCLLWRRAYQIEMAGLQVFAVVLLAFWGIAYASNTKTKCEVVNALQNAGARESDMRDCKWNQNRLEA